MNFPFVPIYRFSTKQCRDINGNLVNIYIIQMPQKDSVEFLDDFIREKIINYVVYKEYQIDGNYRTIILLKYSRLSYEKFISPVFEGLPNNVFLSPSEVCNVFCTENNTKKWMASFLRIVPLNPENCVMDLDDIVNKVADYWICGNGLNDTRKYRSNEKGEMLLLNYNNYNYTVTDDFQDFLNQLKTLTVNLFLPQIQ